METLTVEEQRTLQQELTSGESLLWSGKPNPKVIFHSSDTFTIPFSLLWGGFAIFWELGVSGIGFMGNKGPSSFMQLWGIPFVIIGQYMIWGRFFYAAWKKRRVLYAITNRRVLVTVRPPGAKTISAFLENIPSIDKELRPDGIGTLKFGSLNDSPWQGKRNKASIENLYLSAGIPVFVDIDNASAVFDIVTDLRLRASNRETP